MLLVFDVGNTNTVIGLYSEGELIKHWRISSCKQTTDEAGAKLSALLFASGISKEKIEACVYSSVVPPLDDVYISAVKDYVGCDCIIVSVPTIKSGIEIKIPEKNTLGADRLLNIIAGRYKYGSPLIVVDLGTAITIDVLDCEGNYVGGAISPGMELAVSSLFSNAALLPKVSLNVAPKYIATDTEGAIQSGIVLGTAGMVDSLLRGTIRELGVDNCKIVVTGGYSHVYTKYSELECILDPELTLDGMKIIYEKKMY